MKYLKHMFRLALMAYAIALSGCGGEERGTSTPEPPATVPMLAMDGFRTVTPKQETFIDLTPYIRGTNVTISGVHAAKDDENCGAPTVSGQGVNVYVAGGEFCEFTYTASQPGAKSTRASLNVLATKATEPTLRPLSEALIVGGDNVDFNVQKLLGADWKETYSLHSVNVVADGSDNAGTVTKAGNTITFTPPELVGWNRIIYTLNNSADADASVMGEIYVTVSNEINHPPTIEQPKYDYNKYNSSEPIHFGTTTTLNLATLPGLNISDPDAEDWQLIAVQSFTATVEATDPVSTSNKSINFTAPTVGDHFVNYIVADHLGGYSMGSIKVNVEAKGGAASWRDIKTSKITFTAPATYAQASNKGYHVNAIWDVGVNNTIAGFSTAAANSYCSTKGRIPSVKEMQVLFDSAVPELGKWPKHEPFLALDGTSPVAFNMVTGAETIGNAAGAYYLTCIKYSNMKLDMLTQVVIANGTEQPVAEVRMDQPGDTFDIGRGEVGSTLTEAEAGVSRSTVQGSSTTLVAAGTKAGMYTLKVTDESGETLLSPVISYIGDRATATGTLNASRLMPNGVTPSPLSITLRDAYGNPVKDVRLTITAQSDGITFDPPTVTTGEDGTARTAMTAVRGIDTTVNVRFADSGTDVGQKQVQATARSYTFDTVTAEGYRYFFELAPGEAAVPQDLVVFPDGYMFNQTETYVQLSPLKDAPDGIKTYLLGQKVGGIGDAIYFPSAAGKEECALEVQQWFDGKPKELWDSVYWTDGDYVDYVSGDTRTRGCFVTTTVGSTNLTACPPNNPPWKPKYCLDGRSRPISRGFLKTVSTSASAALTRDVSLKELYTKCGGSGSSIVGGEVRLKLTAVCPLLHYSGDVWQPEKNGNVSGTLRNNLGIALDKQL
ncbi:Ig-like domain-containing protein [Vibrio sp. Sgm 5]|uniref:Ig-like domain-containing protein n=1 Tax=Vibrio sp. Sgm 5 TaxID=2994387 RepID=UPI0022494AEB|nr:Ig-like domain-containing protein [Vibrio sp. Sgm 5]MCX2790690.1 Ig-like domain-containing protein [Vibrio sp. Sgm 5]